MVRTMIGEEQTFKAAVARGEVGTGSLSSSRVNMIQTRKREHSRKPDEQYDLVEACSTGPYLELFARGERPGWAVLGNQADETYAPTWKTYSYK